MKILVINPDYQDATSYYRAWGTFKDLNKRFGIEFKLYESIFVRQPKKGGEQKIGVSWPDLIGFDVVFFQRSMGTASLGLLEYCKELGLKVWYDLDDDLWNIPDSFEIKNSFNLTTMNSIENHIKAADLVTCSTKALANVIFDKTDVSAHVIHNAWDIDRFPLVAHNEHGRIMWRGSSTHVDDIRANREVIENIGKYDPITFMGHDPVKGRPYLNLTYDFVKPLDPIIYFRTLLRMRPKAMLVPLKDIPFNESKSSIAWLEATAAGAATYSNGVGEFKYKGLRFEDYGHNIARTMNDYIEEQQQILIDSYNLKDKNNDRYTLLSGLFR